MTTKPATPKRGKADLYEWDPEDDDFWEREGKRVATRPPLASPAG